MNRLKKIALFSSAALILCGCAKESTPNVQNTGNIILIDPPSKVDIIDGLASAIAGDQGQQSSYNPTYGEYEENEEQGEKPPKLISYSLGTGAAKENGAKPDLLHSTALISLATGMTEENGYPQLTCLKDYDFQKQINEDLKAAVDSLKVYFDEKYTGPDISGFDGIHFDCEVRNGYISFIFGYINNDIQATGYRDYKFDVYDHAVTLTYDLVGKKKIEHFSDLFYEGEDFMPLVNEGLYEIARRDFVMGMDVEEKSDFYGISEEPKLFTIESIILEADNPYYDCGPKLDFYSYGRNESVLDLSPLSKYRDYKEIFTQKFVEKNYLFVFDSADQEYEETYYKEGDITFIKYVSSRFHTAKEIEKENEIIFKVQHVAAPVFAEYGVYASTRIKLRPRISNNGTYWKVYSNDIFLNDTMVIVDAETYKILTCEDLFGENWTDYLDDPDWTHGDAEAKDYLPNHWAIEGNEVFVVVTHFDDSQYFLIPYSEVNHKYTWKEEE